MLEIEGKMITRSRAIVIDNKDPLKKGRIRVKHPILGDTTWINFIKDEGSFGVPGIGNIVYLECDCGYETHPIAHGVIPKGTDTVINVPEVFRRLNPTNKGFYTPNGHLIEMDDGEGLSKTGKGIRLTTSKGIVIKLDDIEDSVSISNINEDSIVLSKSEGIIITSKSDTVNDASGSHTISSGSEHSLVITDSNVTLSSGETNLTLTDSDATLSEPGGALLNLASGKVKLGTDTAEVITIVQNGLKALTDNASALVLTNVGPGQLSPAVVALLMQLQTLLDTIKA